MPPPSRFGEVAAARQTAEQAADISGSARPIISFLSIYGRYLNETQLNILGQLYLSTPQMDYEPRIHYLERLLAVGVDPSIGIGDRYITSIVGRKDIRGVTTEFRLIRTKLTGQQDYEDLTNAIQAQLQRWQRNSNVAGFVVLEPIWRAE